jgi:hypothetical protein
MKKIMKSLAACVFVPAVATYIAIYGYYRIIDRDGVLEFIGAPGDHGIGESFSGTSLVTCIYDLTGIPVATIANRVYLPIAFLDCHLTGRHIKFNDHVAQPVFTKKLP